MTQAPVSFDAPTTIIYHGASCRDGFCAAWLAREAFTNAEFVPAVHGDPPPNVAGRQVLIVDFSYSAIDLFSLHNDCIGPLVVLDHHWTAKRTLDEFQSECEARGMDPPHVEFSETHSGAMMMLNFLSGLASRFSQHITPYIRGSPPMFRIAISGNGTARLKGRERRHSIIPSHV